MKKWRDIYNFYTGRLAPARILAREDPVYLSSLDPLIPPGYQYAHRGALSELRGLPREKLFHFGITGKSKIKA